MPPRDVDAYFVRPQGGNTGDLLLSHGCIWYLEERGLRVWISDGGVEHAALAGDTAYLNAAIGGFDGLVVFPGGGNIGRYLDNGQIRAGVIAALSRSSTCLVLPNTYFAPEPALVNSQVVVWARDRTSHERFRQFGFRTALVPDAAFALHQALPRFPAGEGTYLILRGDAESAAHGVSSDHLEGVIGCSDLTLESSIPGLLSALESCEYVVSDRLHGALVALMLGKKVVLLPVDYHKARSFYDTWLGDVPAIAFAEDLRQARSALRELGQRCPDLTDLFRSVADPLLDDLL